MSEQHIASYLDEDTLPFHFCPGCGHAEVLSELNQALVTLQLDPKKVVIVTDIGCSGLSDKYFSTNALHGLHGRSVTYATGIKLANSDLKVIVLMGDGGCGIGGHHLISAARRNIGVTVLVFNNMNYGMTGGEHSATTPLGAITTTSRYGHLENPMDICATVSVNGASFVARTTTFDNKLTDLIVDAISNDGFSLVDIWELCTAYYVPNNRYSRKTLERTLDELGFAIGVIRKVNRPEYSRAYREANSEQLGEPLHQVQPVELKFGNSLEHQIRLGMAGSAGMKIVTTANLFCQGALASGLWATQRNDYPVTVMTGFSLSEVILDSEEVIFTGFAKPDILIVLSSEGLQRVRSQIRNLEEGDMLFINSKLLPVQTRAKIISLDLRAARKKSQWAIWGLAELLHQTQIYPIEGLRDAIADHKHFAKEYLVALDSWKLHKNGVKEK